MADRGAGEGHASSSVLTGDGHDHDDVQDKMPSPCGRGRGRGRGRGSAVSPLPKPGVQNEENVNNTSHNNSADVVVATTPPRKPEGRLRQPKQGTQERLLKKPADVGPGGDAPDVTTKPTLDFTDDDIAVQKTGQNAQPPVIKSSNLNVHASEFTLLVKTKEMTRETTKEMKICHGSLSADAKEFIPGGFQKNSQPQQQLESQQVTHPFGQPETIPSWASVPSPLTTPSNKFAIDRVKQVVFQVTTCPGNLEGLMIPLIKDLNKTRVTLADVIEIGGIIFEQAVMELNFTYTGAKMCRWLVDEFKPLNPMPEGAQIKFQDVLMKRCQAEQEYRLQTIGDIPARLHGFTRFMAELFVNMKVGPPGAEQRIKKLGEALKELVQLLLQHPTDANMKCVVQVLKCAGAALEDDERAKTGQAADMDNSIGLCLQHASSPAISQTTQAMLRSVANIRATNWGRGESALPPVAPVPAASVPQAFTQSQEVAYPCGRLETMSSWAAVPSDLTTPSYKYAIDRVKQVVLQMTTSPGNLDEFMISLINDLNDTPVTLTDVIDIVNVIFEQAVLEPNFTYTGARMCDWLVRKYEPMNETTEQQPIKFLSVLMKRCQVELGDKLRKVVENPARLHGFTLLMAELYLTIKLGIPGAEQRIVKLEAALKELIQLLLEHPTDANMKCVVQALKCAGAVLEDEERAKTGQAAGMNYLISLCSQHASSPGISQSAQAMLRSVENIRATNWGREQSAPPPVAPEPAASVPQAFTQSQEVTYPCGRLETMSSWAAVPSDLTTPSYNYAIDRVKQVVFQMTTSPGNLDEFMISLMNDLNETPVTLTDVIDIVNVIFEQAVLEPNFTYTGARMCDWLVRKYEPLNETTEQQPIKFLSVLMKRCQVELEGKLQKVVGNPARLHGFTLLTAELYLTIKLGIPGAEQRIDKLEAALKELIQLLLEHPTDANMKCVVQALKCAGAVLEDEERDKTGQAANMDYLISLCSHHSSSPAISQLTQAMLKSVADIRARNWGRRESASPPVAAVRAATASLGFTQDDPVFFNANGEVITREEAGFAEEELEEYSYPDGVELQEPWSSEEQPLELQYENGYLDDPEIDFEMAEAFQQFLIDTNQA